MLTLFGIIHSVMPTGALYLPWQINSHAHYMLTVAYLALSGIFLLLTEKLISKKAGIHVYTS